MADQLTTLLRDVVSRARRLNRRRVHLTVEQVEDVLRRLERRKWT